MAALTAASWTIVITDRKIEGARRTTYGTLAIPGTDTYPNDGIPLPDKGKFGFVRQFDGIVFFGVSPAAGTVAEYFTRYDKTNHKMFLYEEEAAAAGGPLLEADTGEVPGARTWDFVAWGW